MDQKPSMISDQRQIDRNSSNNSSCNNNITNFTPQKTNECSCSNISIMQLFHEMKQEFPKVPDNIVQQLVTENCHNRRACLEKLQKVVSSSPTTSTMYPSKSIHNSNQQTPRSPINNGVRWGTNRKMKEISEKFENTSISSSSETSTSSDTKIKRPTTLPLRRAPDPPSISSSTPSSTTSVSSFSSSQQTHQYDHFSNDQQIHHNIILDTSASKINDSLRMQLDLKVSPVSTKRPAPPPPTKPQNRFVSHLNVQPEPAFTKMLDSKKSAGPFAGASTCIGTTGQKSYTNVTLTLRQPSSIVSSPQEPVEPIDIQVGPQKFTYSSTSFNAREKCRSQVKITVENGESSIQAVRTTQNPTEINQIDTTINIEGKYNVMNSEMENSSYMSPYRLMTSPLVLPQLQPNDRLTEDQLRQLIKRQIKQKESLECELEKEREKLQMIRLDIITLTSPIMTQNELKELYDEITRLRSVCERLSDEIDVATAPQRSPLAINACNSPNAPPPIPRGLVSRKGHSPSHSLLPQLDTAGIRYPISQPPSYNEVMHSIRNEPQRSPVMRESNSYSNIVDEKWTCTMCTFQNHGLLNLCEACEMPRVQGITITSSSYRPLNQNNHLQGASSVPTNDSNNNNNNNNHIIQATAL